MQRDASGKFLPKGSGGPTTNGVIPEDSRPIARVLRAWHEARFELKLARIWKAAEELFVNAGEHQRPRSKPSLSGTRTSWCASLRKALP